MITVYTKPNCMPCKMTKRTLDNAGIAYKTVDVTEDQAAFDLIVSMGFSSAPVVVAGDQSWAGFQPDRLSALTALAAA